MNEESKESLLGKINAAMSALVDGATMKHRSRLGSQVPPALRKARSRAKSKTARLARRRNRQ